MVSKLQAFVNASPKDLETSMKTASQRFGVSELKKQQKSAVEATLCGKDVFVSLPTGFGKSLIYQLLPICAKELAILSPVGPDFKPFVLIVSPLGLALSETSGDTINMIQFQHIRFHCMLVKILHVICWKV